MTEHQADESSDTSDTSETLRAELVYGFGEYHTPIRLQVALVDQLIQAVRLEERERCAAVAERIGREAWPSKGECLGIDTADAIRTQSDDG